MSVLAKDKFLISATTISVEGAGTLSQSQLSEAIKVQICILRNVTSNSTNMETISFSHNQISTI